MLSAVLTFLDSLSHRSQEFILEGNDKTKTDCLSVYVDLRIPLFLQLGSFFTLWVINQLRRLNLRVQSPGRLCYFSLGPVPALIGRLQYLFCKRSPLSCLVVVLHLKELISAHSPCAHDNIPYQTDVKPTALLTHLNCNHLLSQLLLWPLLLSEPQRCCCFCQTSA